MAVESKAIDNIDRRILDELRISGRMSWRELGELVHLSPSSVAERVRRLEREGVITGYTARVDAVALGKSVRAVVDVGLPAGAEIDEFERELAQRDEVVFAAYVTGSSDYSIVVECVGAEGLDAFVRWLRGDAGVAHTETKLLLRVVADAR